VVEGSVLLDYKATSVGNWFQMVHSNVVPLSSRVHMPEKSSFQTMMITNYIPLKHQELITQSCNIVSQKSLQLQTLLLRFYTASSTETTHQFLCFVDCASYYNVRQWPTWYTLALFYNTFII